MEVDKWFTQENFAEIRNPLTLEAISTLFPDQYLAGDAIKLATKSLNLVLESDTYFTHSIQIRAWLIQMIAEGPPEDMSWEQSLKTHMKWTNGSS